MRIRHLAVLALTLTAACAAPSEDTDDSAGAASTGPVRTIWPKDVNSDGWKKVITEVASDKLQDAISGDRAKLSWDVRAATSGPNVKKSNRHSIHGLHGKRKSTTDGATNAKKA